MLMIADRVGMDAVNRHADARIVQTLLNQNRNRVPDAREIPVDGIVGPKTIAAIRRFQQTVVKLDRVDGRVDPDGRTLKALIVGSQGPANGPYPDPAPPPMAAPALEKPICFPLRSKSVPDYHVPLNLQRPHHHRYFGAGRKTKAGAYRAHAACDLIVPPATPVLAIEQGVVRGYEPGFFENTDALVVEHDNGLVVRYGEISRAADGLRLATPVVRGQVVGFVGRNKEGSAMLHIEFYAGKYDGPLSGGANVFLRRGNLVDPTSYLDNATVDKAS